MPLYWVEAVMTDYRLRGGGQYRSSNEPLDIRGTSGGWTLHDLNEVAVRITHEADS
jgi:hypothetical protein